MHLKELIKDKNNKKIIDLTIKQLSLGRYSFFNGVCSVKIKYSCQLYKILIDSSLTRGDLRNFLNNNLGDLNKEPSIINFNSRLISGMYEIDSESTGKQILVEFLKQYKEFHLKSGSKLEYNTLYKLYSRKYSELDYQMREYYGADYIDYAKQLKNQKWKMKKFINNEGNINGIWVMSSEYLKKCNNKNSVKLYGSRLLILKPLKKCEYFIFKVENEEGLIIEEIIGDRFQVLKDVNFKNKTIDDTSKFIKNKI